MTRTMARVRAGLPAGHLISPSTLPATDAAAENSRRAADLADASRPTATRRTAPTTTRSPARLPEHRLGGL